jgi:hypothetical protein
MTTVLEAIARSLFVTALEEPRAGEQRRARCRAIVCGMRSAERRYVLDRISQAEVTLTVNFADGRCAVLSLLKCETIGAVKTRVAKTVGVPEFWQQLFVPGVEHSIPDRAVIGSHFQGETGTLFCLLSEPISDGAWDISAIPCTIGITSAGGQPGYVGCVHPSHPPDVRIGFCNRQVTHLGESGWRSVACDRHLFEGQHQYCIRLGLPGTEVDADYVIGCVDSSVPGSRGQFYSHVLGSVHLTVASTHALGAGQEHGVQFAGPTFPRSSTYRRNTGGLNDGFWPFSTGTEAVLVHIEIDMEERTMCIDTEENRATSLSPAQPLLFRDLPASVRVCASVRYGGVVTIL